jgi:hypothetical protein
MDGLRSLSRHAMQVRQDPSVSDQDQMLCEHMVSLIHCKLVEEARHPLLSFMFIPNICYMQRLPWYHVSSKRV